MNQPNTASNNGLKYLLYFGFLLSGISTVLIGQILPFIEKKFQLNDLQLTYFFWMQFSGSIGGAILTKIVSQRYGFMLASLIGCLLMAGGVLLLGTNSYYLCVLGCLLNGLGIGMTLPAINMTIVELNPLAASSSLNILNFFWGIGAIFSNPFVNYFRNELDFFLAMVILSVLLVFVAGGITVLGKINVKQIISEDNLIDYSTPIWSRPIAWVIALFNFVHVGFETAMGGWLATYTQRLDANTLISWLQPIFLYFLFFVLGRGIAPMFFRFLSDNKVLLLSLAVVLIGLITAFSTSNGIILSIGASIAGFGTSSIFPTNMSRFTKTFGPSSSRRATPFFICGTLGAAFTTWIIGFTSTYFNDLRSGLSILFASCGLLIVLQIILGFKSKEQST